MGYATAQKASGASEPPAHQLPSSASFESLNRQLTRAKDHLKTSTSSLERLHRKVTTTETEISDLQKHIAQLRNKLAAKYHELEGYQDMIPYANGEVERAKARLERLEECAVRVKKDMRVEAWMEEMEREEEREQEGFSRYLQEVGRAGPDSVANIKVRSASPARDAAEDVKGAFDGTKLREALAESIMSPPAPPTHISDLIEGGHEADPDAPLFRSMRRARQSPPRRPAYSREPSPQPPFVTVMPMRRSPSPQFIEPVVFSSPPPPPPPPEHFQAPFPVPGPIGSPVPVPVHYSPPPMIVGPNSQMLGSFLSSAPSPMPAVGMQYPMGSGTLAPVPQPGYNSQPSFVHSRGASPDPLDSPIRRGLVITPPVQVHHGSPPSPRRFAHSAGRW